MWCVGVLTEQYRSRMYELLALYARPLRRDEPVVCVDEKSTQLLQHSRTPLPMQPGRAARHDYEYKRAGTANLFVAVEPKRGRRTVTVHAPSSSGPSPDPSRATGKKRRLSPSVASAK